MTAIGPAGEKLVRFACCVNEDDRAAGRGGVGAVAGSKRLKAIVIKAAKKVPKASDAQAWKAAHKRALAAITNVLMNITNTMGALPAYNSKVTSFGPRAEAISDLHAFSDSLDLCKFSAFAQGPEEYAAQYAAMTGNPCTADDVLKIGERIYNLERYYNNLAGFREGSDSLPQRFLTEPSTMPGSQGHVCELGPMLAEYYEARGWVDGVVPEAKLRELEIA